MTLAGCRTISFVPVTDRDAAKAFYAGTLGLPIAREDPDGTTLRTRDGHLRLSLAPHRFTPAPFTVHGWEVDDIGQAVAALRASGVRFERYAFMPQDAAGIWTAPNGDKIAWFKDPAGNLLSLTQFANVRRS